MSELRVLGLDEVDEHIYRAVLRHPGHARDELAGMLGRTYDEIAASLRRLNRLGLVELRHQQAFALPPAEAVTTLIAAARRDVAARQREVEQLRGSLPSFFADYDGGAAARDAGAAVEAVVGITAVNAVVADLLAQPTGELLAFVRPPITPALSAASPRLLRRPGEPPGARGARLVYDAELLHQPEWWVGVRELREAGEQVRAAVSVPTKLLIVTGHAAVLPLDYSAQDGNNGLLVRDPAIVTALTALFEQVWADAVPITASEGDEAGSDASGADAHNSDVLALLASGAKDEAIARQLGLSVRSVRRRVAVLLESLEARTRFEAGVQAVRRRWL